MAKIVVVTSGKGGVGKTTTSASFATGLAKRGYKTVVIDFINQSISALSITRIIVAHRPSTIASADRVIDLSQSKSVTTA